MESLAELLEPYTKIITGTASVVTYFHSLSGVIVCNGIRKKKSTGDSSIIPFLIGTLMSSIHLGYSLIINDLATILKGFVVIGLNTAYLSCFLYYITDAKNRKLAHTQVGCVLAFLCAVFIYTLFENPEVLRFRYGIIVSAVMAVIMTHPVISLVHGIRNRTSKGIPLPMILPLTMMIFLWLLYGIIKRDHFMISQNAIVFLLMAAQLSLFIIYPTRADEPKKHKTKVADDNKNKKSD